MTAIKQTVTIQSGGRVEVISGELPEGRQAEVIILVDPSHIQTAAPLIIAGHDAKSSQPEEQDQEYSTADFIEPTKYDWNLNIFMAERAVREYLKDSLADY
ncbi:MAG: hypothetical protein ACLQGP_27320 [Isosphaeraceae bacterium]